MTNTKMRRLRLLKSCIQSVFLIGLLAFFLIAWIGLDDWNTFVFTFLVGIGTALIGYILIMIFIRKAEIKASAHHDAENLEQEPIVMMTRRNYDLKDRHMW